MEHLLEISLVYSSCTINPGTVFGTVFYILRLWLWRRVGDGRGRKDEKQNIAGTIFQRAIIVHE